MIAYLVRRGRLYTARIRIDGWPKARTFALGVSDKHVATEMLWKRVKRLEKQSVGLLPSDETLEAVKAPILAQLAVFLADTEARGRSPNTVKAYRRCIPLLCKRCGWVHFPDITARSFENWRSLALAGNARDQRARTPRVSASVGIRREERPSIGTGDSASAPRLASQRIETLAPKYVNDLLGYMRGFLRWCERRGMLEVQPLRHVQPSRLRSGRGYRRALSPEQFRQLLAAVPKARAAVYMTAYYLGLRRAELNRLKRGDFDLDGVPATVRIPATATKNGRAELFELRSELAGVLREYWSGEPSPFAWAFYGRVPNMDTFKRDLSRAGIPFLDGEGRRFDFHALREMLCTHLHEAGVSMRVAMAIMRHSDARLTMRVYTDEARVPVAEGLAKLPAFGDRAGEPADVAGPVRGTNTVTNPGRFRVS